MLDAWSGKAPSPVGILPRSRFGEHERSRAVAAAVQAARGTPVAAPVLYGPDNLVLGHVRGLGYRDPRVLWIPERRPRPLREFWCGFANYDAIISATTSGQRLPLGWTKVHTTAPVANNWGDLWPVSGMPVAGAYSGSAFTAKQFDDTVAGSLWHGGNVSTLTKHLIAQWSVSSGGTPTLMLYDRVLTYEACAFNAAANQAFTNTLTAQRYQNNGQSGMQIICTCQTALGATAANITRLAYTDNAGNAAQLMPTGTTVAHIVSAAAPTANLGARVVAPATAAATLPWGPFMPLLAGDGGVRKIEDWTTSAANTGTICFVLGRPLAWLPIATAGVASAFDLVMQLTNLERVYDGACLTLMAYFPAATASTLTGGHDVAWA